jgi:hypothetical protein
MSYDCLAGERLLISCTGGMRNRKKRPVTSAKAPKSLAYENSCVIHVIGDNATSGLTVQLG